MGPWLDGSHHFAGALVWTLDYNSIISSWRLYTGLQWIISWGPVCLRPVGCHSDHSGNHRINYRYILSDARFIFQGNEARLQIKQKDQAFVQLLWHLFNEIGIVGAEPQLISAFLKETGQTYSAYGFKTLTLPYFTELHSIWYVKTSRWEEFQSYSFQYWWNPHA